MLPNFMRACLAAAALVRADVMLEGGAAQTPDWTTSIDGVMGGRSSMSWRYEGGVLEATGYLNTNGGGFAGLWRRLEDPVDLGAYGAIEVTYEALAADAAPLALELRLGGGSSWAGADFGAAFALAPSAVAGAAGRATIPFAAFRPRNWQGSQVAGDLDVSAVDEVGFQILMQEGAFDVRIRSVAAVEWGGAAAFDDPPPALEDPSPAAVVSAIDATIARGSYVYNKGYHHLCDAVYAATARGLAEALAGRSGRRGDAAAALLAASGAAESHGYSAHDASARAWALRHGLDAARAEAVSAGTAWDDDDRDDHHGAAAPSDDHGGAAPSDGDDDLLLLSHDDDDDDDDVSVGRSRCGTGGGDGHGDGAGDGSGPCRDSETAGKKSGGGGADHAVVAGAGAVVGAGLVLLALGCGLAYVRVRSTGRKGPPGSPPHAAAAPLPLADVTVVPDDPAPSARVPTAYEAKARGDAGSAHGPVVAVASLVAPHGDESV